MLDLFYQGGPLFMGILTLIFIAMITTIYGLIIYALSLLIWFGFSSKLGKK